MVVTNFDTSGIFVQPFQNLLPPDCRVRKAILPSFHVCGSSKSISLMGRNASTTETSRFSKNTLPEKKQAYQKLGNNSDVL